ncbi:serine palmitoyltransferase 1 isoform X2 [Episyrphus balteatus]|nr:serine palmitoyltransferase 1 isoform X2 [Episyrphus balteatus]XP_055854984.1 serine palmitoyltransferase 1 isoform X2 [Episyrphus balteatus]XP_055854994.1 serine palmitoyltransferase 1 isoform X2 [Episyrphus balteatus]XP_055855002.1 serine palmitoyltransferase 1 isoform X2 [Episyrphus balteatus]XP_055855006.1 serine palmitoyltransferase 1 isoform X2 [Episyrphus balteatus]
MAGAPYILNEIDRIIRNTPLYALVLEAFLLLSVIWLILYKRNGRKRYTSEEEEALILSFEPEALVAEVDKNHPALKPRMVSGKVGKYIVVNGYTCLNLSTHNYLGLLEDEKILEDAVHSLRKYGVGSCGPRGFYGTVDVHLELEERLAKFMGTEEAVVYSYGFSTVASAIPAYSKRTDVIFVDESVNFSIQKGLDASRSKIFYYKHNDMADLERLLVEQQKRDLKNPSKAAKTRRFLVAEGIYMNTGEICPLPELVALRSKYKLRLFLDESISFGTLGKTGHGLTEYFNVDRIEVDLICAGMEWAVASIGGFCVGSSFIVEHQRLSGLGYCFSASLPPLLTQAAISALDRFETDPQIFSQLESISRKMHLIFSKFSKLTLRGNEISPVKHLYLKHSMNVEEEQQILAKIADKCIENNIALIEAHYLEALEKLPPKPSLRVTSNLLLTDKELNAAFEVIERVSNGILE